MFQSSPVVLLFFAFGWNFTNDGRFLSAYPFLIPTTLYVGGVLPPQVFKLCSPSPLPFLTPRLLVFPFSPPNTQVDSTSVSPTINETFFFQEFCILQYNCFPSPPPFPFFQPTSQIMLDTNMRSFQLEQCV